jgi:hypothetical protein
MPPARLPMNGFASWPGSPNAYIMPDAKRCVQITGISASHGVGSGVSRLVVLAVPTICLTPPSQPSR